MIDMQPLFEEMTRRHLSVIAVSMRAGIHFNTVHRVLAGEACNTDSLEAVAKALGYKVVLVKRSPKS